MFKIPKYFHFWIEDVLKSKETCITATGGSSTNATKIDDTLLPAAAAINTELNDPHDWDWDRLFQQLMA